ncbi:MAG: dockerin type I repeat-containing protein, partial [Oscillospiraceae bacterium]|nr:dockerin type I repeat-containing protein [Oscillospiraceae bacterium]
TTTTTTTTTSTTPKDEPSNVRYGDVNCDGVVKIDDVVLINRYAAEDTSISISDQGMLNADCAFNDKVDTTDAVAILQYLAGLLSYGELGKAS